jgi:hypothetical protein
MAVIVVGVSVAFVSPASSWAWGSPQTLAPDSASYPSAAVGASGVAVVAWSREIDSEHSAVDARVRAPSGDWGPVQTLSVAQDAQNWKPSAAVDAQGDVLVVWDAEQASNPGYEGIRAAFAPVGQPFAAPALIASDHDGYGDHRPVVSFDAVGNAVAMWWQQDGLVHWAQRPSGGNFGAPQAIGLGESTEIDDAAFAIGADGDAVAAWLDQGVAYAAVRLPGGGFSEGRRVGGRSNGMHVGIGADGTAVITLLDHEAAGAGYQMAVAIRQGRSDTFGPVEYVAPVADALPAISPQGQVTLIGSDTLPGAAPDDVVWALTRAPDGSWGAPEQVAPYPDAPDEPPAIAFEADGTLRLAWKQYESSEFEHVIAHVLAARRPAGGAFTGQVDTVATVDDILGTPALATDPDGHAITAWSTGPFGIGAIQTAGDDPAQPPVATPTPSPTVAPPTATATPSPTVAPPADPVASSPSASAPAAQAQAGASSSTAPIRQSAGRADRRRCTVPALRGLRLATARRHLRARGCRLGHVTRARHHHGPLRVRRQSPAPRVRTFSPVRLRLG